MRPATRSSRKPAAISSRATESSSTAATPRDGRSDDGVRRPGQRNDAALLGSLNGARVGRILLESEVGARPVVVAEVAAQTTSKVRLVQDDDVVEKLAADGSNHSLGEGVLPGRARCGEHLGDAHAPPVAETRSHRC